MDLEKVRLKIYLRHLLPLKDEAKELDVSMVDFTKDCFVVSLKDLYREVFVLGLLSLKKKKSYRVMSAYRLLDIMLEHDLVYHSVAHINEDILMLTLGYDEMENKRQTDIINQTINIRRMRGKHTWIFFKGSMYEANSMKVCIKPICIDKVQKKGSRVI